MPLYVTDYLGDTGHLSTLEHGAYLLLIMHYWQHESLPATDDDLAIIARMTTKEWGKIRNKLSRFFQSGWRHKRIDAELNESETKYEKRVAAGKLGGKAKAKKLALERQEAKQMGSNASGNGTRDASSIVGGDDGGNAGSSNDSEPLANGYQLQPHTPYPSRKGRFQEVGNSSSGLGGRAASAAANGSVHAGWDDDAAFDEVA
ncbi:DUF1376 domain-containing protein [Lichenihabitans sp. PAMC28606]|uniref:YdaU family protein n=1 Tax=Lichenihabitans sp. PAMC28606 TaxID=2880932 RepID=UPI001D0A1026|nr:DUF1376 domain-containing protein [Lichenihabitans sp. PAMC28606]UDL95480.1 DUF1376 domain-containing protein [Lichenihabitans sp. PAMC28606]